MGQNEHIIEYVHLGMVQYNQGWSIGVCTKSAFSSTGYRSLSRFQLFFSPSCLVSLTAGIGGDPLQTRWDCRPGWIDSTSTLPEQNTLTTHHLSLWLNCTVILGLVLCWVGSMQCLSHGVYVHACSK